MKKKFRFFMAAFAAVGLMASCSSEVVNPGQGDNNLPVIEGASTFATFSFSVKQAPSSKAASVTDASIPYTTESAVKDIRLIIFKTGASTTCEVNEMYKSGETGFDDKLSKTVVLTSGTKKIFVVANAEGLGTGHELSESKVVPGTTTLAEFYDIMKDLGTGTTPVTALDLAKITSDANGYIMSNAINADCQKVLVGGITESDSRGATAGDETKNNFSFNIQRVVSKGKVVYTDLNTADGMGKLMDGNNIKYGIRNVNRSVYFFQKFSSDAVVAGAFPRSPYYNTMDSWTMTELEDLSKFAPYYYSDYALDMVMSPVGNLDAANSVYFTENTNSVPRRGNNTYAAVEAVFMPKKDKYITAIVYQDFNDRFVPTLGTVDINSGVDLYLLKDVGSSQGLTANCLFTNMTAAYTAAWAVENPGQPTINMPISYIPPADLLVKYTGGKCYYRLDFGEGTAPDITWGVKRNNMYRATISKFASIGEPALTDLDEDPEIPLGEKTHVTASITVLDWENADTSQEI